MSSHFLYLSPFPPTPTAITTTSPSITSLQPTKFLHFHCLGAWPFGGNDRRHLLLHFDTRPRCSAVSKRLTQTHQEYEVLQDGLPVIKWAEIVDDELGIDAAKVCPPIGVEEHVGAIKSILQSMGDGEISISAYDTAWVALVGDINGGVGDGGEPQPQFPEALEWIADNQNGDGSWGDTLIFSPHDRIINTLACVVALKYRKIHPDKCEKGISFFKENLSKLGDENSEHMPIGFEVAFPSLIEFARKLDIEICEESPVLQEIYARRNLKLNKIPKDIMHEVPTTLLHSLEGMEGLEWEKLLKLQSPDGSFLFSPSSTAFALMQTKDLNCLNYLKRAVQRFHGGVPNVYPVDLFERLWSVDRLQRLGISRFFKEEIKECVSYVHRYWSNRGICWARNSRISDIDDTSMGFRLLRLHGYEVSTDVFEQFKNGDEFFSFMGQSTEAVTGMFNLYRASQLRFPGEKILADAKKYAIGFLRRKREANELLDKWIITKDLPGEVGYALDIPWYASLPRVETRFYIDQYGGENDIWIGKTLYRMPNVNNNVYLDLAKFDYNNCQALHLLEWDHIQSWYSGSKLGDLEMGINGSKTLLHSYFIAAASLYEPERSRERLAWAKTSILVDAIGSYFSEAAAGSGYYGQRRAFAQQFRDSSKNRHHHINGRSRSLLTPNKEGQALIETLVSTLDQLSLEVFVARGQDISHHLRNAWEKWLMACEEDGEENYKGVVELVVQMITLAGDSHGSHRASQELLSHSEYHRLCNLTDTICRRLVHLQQQKAYSINGSLIKCVSGVSGVSGSTDDVQIEKEMQELLELVLSPVHGSILDRDLKDIFLTVTRAFYYTAHCDPRTVDSHIAKVLFERVN